MKDAVLDHLLGNGLLNLSQHGFLPKRSCVSKNIKFQFMARRHLIRFLLADSC